MNVAGPPTPPRVHSPMAHSLVKANASVDELEHALAGFSRAHSPEPAQALACCGAHDQDQCAHLRAWTAVKARLESRLTLSAQVGQALLKKYEAYVRKHEASCRLGSESSEAHEQALDDESETLTREDELIRKNAALEKGLAQALVNAEVTEASNNTLLQELQEARSTVARLSAHHARSLGWEARLKTALHERDDMQQERDALLAQARVAESRTGVLKDKCSKLQTEVRRLQRDLQNQQRHRLELSEEVLQDARAQLQTLHATHAERSISEDGSEVTKVLETLVADNEDLKRSSTELQSLLQESRDDVRALQQELEELRVITPPANPDRPYMRHRYTTSNHSSILSDVSGLHFNPPFVSPIMNRRDPITKGYRTRPESIQVPRHTQVQDPMLITPESSSRPLSPYESTFSSTTQYTSFGAVRPTAEEDESADGAVRIKPHKSLLLLNQSVGVQTDPAASPLPSSLSPLPSYAGRLTPGDRSESSSLSADLSLGALLERAAALLTRMTQADALTLSARLKRQHLSGADVVAHLARTTVDGIVAEAAGLRAPFRALLEDERASVPAGRRELRALLKLLRDAFAELGALRAAVNDVVLDPAAAERIRHAALHPGAKPASGGALGWIAPISKLFGGAPAAPAPSASPAPDARRAPPKIVPKQRPALAASTTTVNVEFSGAGVGRAVTNTWKEDAARRPAGDLPRGDGPPASSSANVMNIFAGAPRADADPWVVLPKAPAPRRVAELGAGPPPSREPSAPATIGRAGTLRKGLSRNVDAMLDGGRGGDEPDAGPPLLQRTLRRRGLSDSSMHSTFTTHGASPPASPVRPRAVPGPAGRVRVPTGDAPRPGLLGALGKSFRFGTPVFSGVPERTASGRSEDALSPGGAGVGGFSAYLPSWATEPEADDSYARGTRRAPDERARGWMGDLPREF